MKTLLRYSLLVCVLAWYGRLSAQTRNPYDLQLRRLQTHWALASATQKLVLLDQIFFLRYYIDNLDQVAGTLHSVETSGNEPQIVRREASALLAELSGHHDSPVE